MSANLGEAVFELRTDKSQFTRGFHEAEREAGQMGGRISHTISTAFGFAMGNAITGLVQQGIGAAKGAIFGLNAQLEESTLQFQTLFAKGDQSAEGLARAADKAKTHVLDLFEFAKKTPFETTPIIMASRLMETFGGAALNTMENLTLIGDAAAATSTPINELGFWVGRLYSSVQAGRPFGEAAMRLGELAVMSPKARMEMERLQKSGAKGEEVWKVFQAELGNFNGAMLRQASTWKGMTSTFTDSIQILTGRAFKPLFDLTKQGLNAVNTFLSADGVGKAIDAFGGGLASGIAMTTKTIKNTILGMTEEGGVINQVATRFALALGVPKGSKDLIGFASTLKAIFQQLSVNGRVLQTVMKLVFTGGDLKGIQALPKFWQNVAAAMKFVRDVGKEVVANLKVLLEVGGAIAGVLFDITARVFSLLFPLQESNGIFSKLNVTVPLVSSAITGLIAAMVVGKVASFMSTLFGIAKFPFDAAKRAKESIEGIVKATRDIKNVAVKVTQTFVRTGATILETVTDLFRAVFVRGVKDPTRDKDVDPYVFDEWQQNLPPQHRTVFVNPELVPGAEKGAKGGGMMSKIMAILFGSLPVGGLALLFREKIQKALETIVRGGFLDDIASFMARPLQALLNKTFPSVGKLIKIPSIGLRGTAILSAITSAIFGAIDLAQGEIKEGLVQIFAPLVGGGIGAAIGAAIGLLGGPLAPITVPAGAALGGAIGMIIGSLFAAIYSMSETVEKYVDKFVVFVWEKLRDFFTDGERIGRILGRTAAVLAVSLAAVLFPPLLGFIIWRVFGDKIKQGFSAVADMFDKLPWKPVGKALLTAMAFAFDPRRALLEVFKRIPWGAIGNVLKDGAESAFKSLGNLFKDALDAFRDTDWREVSIAAGKDIKHGFTLGFIETMKGFKLFFTDIDDWVKDLASYLKEQLAPWDWVKDAWNGFRDGIMDVLKWLWGSGKIMEWVEGLKNFLSTALNPWEWVKLEWELLKTGIAAIIDTIPALFTELPGKITARLADAALAGISIGKKIAEGIIEGLNGFDKLIGGLKDVLGNIWTAIWNKASGPAKAAMNFLGIGFGGGGGGSSGTPPGVQPSPAPTPQSSGTPTPSGTPSPAQPTTLPPGFMNGLSFMRPMSSIGGASGRATGNAEEILKKRAEGLPLGPAGKAIASNVQWKFDDNLLTAFYKGPSLAGSLINIKPSTYGSPNEVPDLVLSHEMKHAFFSFFRTQEQMDTAMWQFANLSPAFLKYSGNNAFKGAQIMAEAFKTGSPADQHHAVTIVADTLKRNSEMPTHMRWLMDGFLAARKGGTVVKVGEEGPELVAMPYDSSILPAQRTRNVLRSLESGAMADQGRVTNINATVNSNFTSDMETIRRDVMREVMDQFDKLFRERGFAGSRVGTDVYLPRV